MLLFWKGVRRRRRFSRDHRRPQRGMGGEARAGGGGSSGQAGGGLPGRGSNAGKHMHGSSPEKGMAVPLQHSGLTPCWRARSLLEAPVFLHPSVLCVGSQKGPDESGLNPRVSKRDRHFVYSESVSMAQTE